MMDGDYLVVPTMPIDTVEVASYNLSSNTFREYIADLVELYLDTSAGKIIDAFK